MDPVKQQKWDGERVMLRSRFVNGDITKATRAELETYLVVLANTGNANKIVGWNETEVVSDVVRHILQVRIAEELVREELVRVAEKLHRKSHRLSIAALWVSIVSAAIAVAAVVVALVH
jgi:hypothetical protein